MATSAAASEGARDRVLSPDVADMTAFGLQSRQMFIMTSNVVSREMNDANVYYRSAWFAGCARVTYILSRGRDTDSVGNDQSCHPLVYRFDLAER